MCVYAQIIERTGTFTCQVLAYSAAAPDGEQGEINTNSIQSILTADNFEKARRLNWPPTNGDERTRVGIARSDR